MAAGIGGGGNGNAYYITINGGNVKAAGGNDGTGIGGGFHGNAYNIEINGGIVNARGYEGAGIGAGTDASYAKNIIINGGNVTARANEGSAIGGGNRVNVENLYITGGTVNAWSKFTGIGGSSYEHFGSAKNIRISGGNVKVYGGIIGIGASTNAPGPNSIHIQGGYVDVSSDGTAIGGGGFSSVLDDSRETIVSISDGTIKADGKYYDIGTQGSRMNYFSIGITGGSIDADSDELYTKPSKTAVNHRDEAVYKTTIKLDGFTGKALISDAIINSDGFSYNKPKNVWTTDKGSSSSELYFWLSEGAEVVSVTVAGKVYRGSIKAGETGTLYLEPEEYTVKFDANIPAGTTSTLYPVSSMNDVTVKNGSSLTLKAPEYMLKGYTFNEWNTRADGSGTCYAAGSSLSDMSSAAGTVLTLYAQWTPQTYNVKFDSNGGSGSMDDQEMVYDEPEQLQLNTFTAPEGMRFAGWKRLNVLGATLRVDGETVINLCDCSNENNKAEGYTLQAQWVSQDTPAVVATLDGEPRNGLEIELRSDDSAEYTVEMTTQQGMTGVYVPKKSGEQLSGAIEEGIYSIYVDDDGNSETGNMHDTGVNITIKNDGDAEDVNFAELPYYTVVVDGDDYLGAERTGGGPVLAGSIVKISAEESAEISDTKYVFDKWNAVECEPEFVEQTSENTSDAKIKINGTTRMTASSRQYVEEDAAYPETEYGYYTISYEANGGEGTVLDENVYEDCAYILANPGFLREGFVMSGWNTKADGTGTAFGIDEEVCNIADAGETVLLYAQWEAADEKEDGDSDSDSSDGTGVTDGSQNSGDSAKAEKNTPTGDELPLKTLIIVMVLALITAAAMLVRKRK